MQDGTLGADYPNVPNLKFVQRVQLISSLVESLVLYWGIVDIKYDPRPQGR